MNKGSSSAIKGTQNRDAGRVPPPAPVEAAPESQSDLLRMQQMAGNRAVGGFLHAGDRNDAPKAAGPAPDGLNLGEGRPLAGYLRNWLENQAGSLPPIHLHENQDAAKETTGANAHGVAAGSHIALEPGTLAGIKGRSILAHEVAHVLQQSSPGLPQAGRNAAEADADSFSNAVTSGNPAAVKVSAPMGRAFKKKVIVRGDLVARISIIVDKRTVIVAMKSGETLVYRLLGSDVKPGSYTAVRKPEGLEVQKFFRKIGSNGSFNQS